VTPSPSSADARPELPPLWQASFDARTLEQYFADLASAADVQSIRTKADPRQHAAADPLTLTAARDLLASGLVRGVQVVYRYDESDWADTVLAVPNGYRIVRMQVPAG
jgi:hypothetical protein